MRSCLKVAPAPANREPSAEDLPTLADPDERRRALYRAYLRRCAEAMLGLRSDVDPNTATEEERLAAAAVAVEDDLIAEGGIGTQWRR